MYNETKLAVRKAISACRVLFSMDKKDYRKLLEESSKIVIPTYEDLLDYDIPQKEAFVKELERRYKEAAVRAGFTEKHGIAMLDYAALQKGLK